MQQGHVQPVSASAAAYLEALIAVVRSKQAPQTCFKASAHSSALRDHEQMLVCIRHSHERCATSVASSVQADQ